VGHLGLELENKDAIKNEMKWDDPGDLEDVFIVAVGIKFPPLGGKAN
jgi:hypothetical protein